MTRPILLALIVVGLMFAGLAASAQTTSAENEDSRYTFNRADDGYLRLDGRTAAQRPGCGHRADKFRSGLLAGRRRRTHALGEIAACRARTLRSRKNSSHAICRCRDGQPEPPAPKAEEPRVQLPSDADLNKVMSFMEKVWRRLVEMIVTLQKDILNKT
jgi:hypothetical protein